MPYGQVRHGGRYLADDGGSRDRRLDEAAFIAPGGRMGAAFTAARDASERGTAAGGPASRELSRHAARPRMISLSPDHAPEDLARVKAKLVSRPGHVLVGTHQDPPRFIRLAPTVERIAHDL